MDFNLTNFEKTTIEMYRKYTDDRSDPMSNVFRLQSFIKIKDSEKLSSMLFDEYDGSGI